MTLEEYEQVPLEERPEAKLTKALNLVGRLQREVSEKRSALEKELRDFENSCGGFVTSTEAAHTRNRRIEKLQAAIAALPTRGPGPITGMGANMNGLPPAVFGGS